MREEYVEFLQQVRGFTGVQVTELRELVRKAMVNRFPASSLVLRKGEASTDLHVLYLGMVRVPLGKPVDGRDAVVELGPGSVIGEMGFLTNGPRSKDVLALTDVTTISWGRHELYHLLSKHPSLARFLSEVLGSRLKQNGLDQVGKYQIVDQIGQGGTALVYHAYHPALGRPVALKMLSHSLVFNQDFRSRFIREARTIAQLNHPNIVQVYDMESHYATYFMVMEYIVGDDLAHILRSNPVLPFEQVISILRQVAQALRFSHRAGIVHGDVKPANCMVMENGVVKLMDFGLCRAIQSFFEATPKGYIFGTPEYTAPELVRGGPTSMATDIYALGVMAYQMVTGLSPFKEETVQNTLRRHLDYIPPSPVEKRPDIPAGLLTFILRAMDKEPARRFEQWDDVFQLLSPDSGGQELEPKVRVVHIQYPEYLTARVDAAIGALGDVLVDCDSIEWSDAELKLKRKSASLPREEEGENPKDLTWMFSEADEEFDVFAENELDEGLKTRQMELPE